MRGFNLKRLIYIFLIAFILRAIFWVFIADYPERAFDNDSMSYLHLSESLLDSHTFPSAFRTPVYPFFISLVYGIFGKFPQLILLSQYLLDSISAVFIALISWRIFRSLRLSYTAGIIYGINPFAIYYANMVLTETLFTFLSLIAIYFLILFLLDQKKIYLVVSALLLGAATLCRPISLYLPLLLVPFIFLFAYTFRKKLVSSAIFLLVSYVILVPWYIRNYQEYGRWTLSTVSDLNFFMSFAPEILAIKENPFTIIQPNINNTIEHFQNDLWDNAKNKYGWYDKTPSLIFKDPKESVILREEGMKIIQDNSAVFFIAHVLGIGRTLCPYYPSFGRLIGNDVKLISLLSFWVDLCIMGFFTIGIFISLKTQPRFKFVKVLSVMMIVMIAYFSFVPGIVGYSRFRIPVLPYISIFSSIGIFRIFKHLDSINIWIYNEKNIDTKTKKDKIIQV